MPYSQLTAISVERACRTRQRFLLNDGQGLYLRKQANSGASWTLRYRFLERDRWMTLGNYPDMSLADARVEARTKRLLIDKKQDPLDARNEELLAKRKSEERERSHFKSLAEDWFNLEIEGRVKNSHAPRRYIDKYLVPEFGSKHPADITPEEAARLLGRVSRDAPTAANDLLRYMKRIFRFGVRRRRLTVSPVCDFNSRDAGGVERHRDRALSQDELVKFLEAMRKSDSFGGQNYLVVKLLLALGVRKGELIKATWDEFDLDGPSPTWHLPSTRSKMKRGIRVPLVPAVVEWLKALRMVAGSSQYVLPQRRRDPHQRYQHVGMDTINAALAQLDHGLEHFTVHDLRRTMRTHLAALGVRSEVAERCLNHQLRGVEGVYNTHDYFEERRSALNAWTNLLLDIENGVRKVTPIHRVMSSNKVA